MDEFNKLHEYLLKQESDKPELTNQYFVRLLNVIDDVAAENSDILMAYRDALSVTNCGDSLPLINKLISSDNKLFKPFDLNYDNFHNNLKKTANEHTVFGEELNSIFDLDNRRNIAEFPIDLSLQKKLNNNEYQTYRGSGQKYAVRLALTTERSNTLIVNLPTGVGKTLVAHSVCAYSKASELSIIIVPTTALAIEQGERMKEIFETMDECHGGEYVWYGKQSELSKRDIKERIKNGEQRVLFVSPESACRSLLPTLLESAKNNKISNIIIDEAHIVEQWGATFRPDFQILAALISRLREQSSLGLKCILMSATFTAKCINTLKELYRTSNKEVIEVHGSFIRPEISYKVHKCNDDKDHMMAISRSVVELPKPLIIYCTTRDKVQEISKHINQELGLNRVTTFTGDTSEEDRKLIIGSWNNDDLDIIIATSAFGVGMNKNNIRAIIHAEVPENIDRYYQDVGRCGRDGKASQAVLIFQESSFDVARSINSQKLITIAKGFDRWKTLWDHRKVADNKILLDLRKFRYGLDRESRSNQEWNWRTLLLMQRSGFIRIEFRDVSHPEWSSDFSESEYHAIVSEYYDKYYNEILITILNDQHLNFSVWEKDVALRRESEIKHNMHGLNLLESWITNPNSRCFGEILQEYYTLEYCVPEYSCSNCPHCSSINRVSKASRTLGKFSSIKGYKQQNNWLKPLTNFRTLQYVYYPNSSNVTDKKLIRTWKTWLANLLEKGAIQLITCEPILAELISKQLPKGMDKFWMYEPLQESVSDETLWPQLVIVSPLLPQLPSIGWVNSPILLLAPDDIFEENNQYRKWWEVKQSSLSLTNFLSSF